MERLDAPAPGVLSLGWVLLRLGAVAFGGLGASLALLERELVARRGWLTERDMRDALAFTKPLPGSTVVQVVAFLGWRLGGWPGAVIGALAFVAPAAVLMTSAAAVAAVLPSASWIASALTGVQIAVIGLLASAMWRLARGEVAGWLLYAVLGVAFAAGFIVNAALIVVGSGLVGVAAESWSRRRD